VRRVSGDQVISNFGDYARESPPSPDPETVTAYRELAVESSARGGLPLKST
jgi:hypothetical protein